MSSEKKVFAFFTLAILLVYIINLQIGVMEVDAAQYASIALEMLQTGSFLEIKDQGQNYLDKPPLLFWCSALFYKLFGISEITYKLPSMLFAFLGIYSTYKFSEIFYSQKVARLAAFMMASSQAIFLTTNDVRTDTILCSNIIFASWQMVLFIKNNSLKNLILSSLGIGLALLSKGPIGLFTVIFAFAPHILLTKQFNLIFKWQWLFMLILIGIILSPMCYGLYKQYGNEGLKFYFWTQSFGRITGESSWSNDMDPFFLFNSFLWSFLPWSLFFILALANKMIELWKTKFSIAINQELICISGIILCLISLSTSKYQLPHYIYVILPYACVLTAAYVEEKLFSNFNSKQYDYVWYGQIFLLSVLWLVGYLLVFISFEIALFYKVIYIILFSIFVYLTFYFFKNNIYKMIYVGLFTIISVNLYLSGHVYPTLLTYQSESIIGKYVKENEIGKKDICYFNSGGFSTSFYSRFVGYKTDNENQVYDFIDKGAKYCFTDFNGASLILNRFPKSDTLLKLKDFHITTLNITFLNPNTRPTTLADYYLLKLK